LPHTFWSIRNKLALMVLITLLPATLGGAILAIDFFNDHYTRDIAQKEHAALKTVENSLEYVVHTAEQDLELLAGLESLQQAVTALTDHTSSVSPAHSILNRLFVDFLETRTVYDQIRILNVRGWEVARANLKDGRAEIVPLRTLQDKSNRYYFQKTRSLAPGEIYVSPIDLNREHGRIEHPLKPMLRIAAPIHDDSGEFLGVLILNFYAQKLLQSATDRSLLQEGQGFWMITDQDGYYLFHPNAEKRWGGPADLDTGENLSSDYALQFQEIRSGQATTIVSGGEDYRTISVKAHLWPDRSRFLTLTHAVPSSHWYNHVFEAIQAVIIPLCAIAFIAGVLAWALGRTITQRLAQMSRTVEQFSRGDFGARSNTVSGNDEIAVLNSRFNIMASALQDLYRNLEHQVAERTAALSASNADLSTSRAKLEAILDNTVDGIVTIDTTGTIQTFNNGASTIFGYEPREMIGHNISMLMPESIAREHNRYLRNHLKTKQSAILSMTREVTGKRKDGTVFPLSLAVNKIILDDVILFTGILRDLTETKKNERRLTATFEQAAVGICHVGVDGRYLQVNATLCRMWGYSREVLETMSVAQTTWETDLTNTSDRFEKLLSGETNFLSAEKIYKTADNTPWWGHLTTSVVRTEEGDVEYFISVIEDINDRKRNEEELRKLSLIARRTDNIVATTDTRGQITWVNDAFIRHTGYSLEEALGHKPGDLLQGPDTNPETVRYMSDKLKNQEGFSAELLNYDKWKTPYWVNLEVQALKDNSGNVTGYMAINQDITERKKNMAMLIKTRNEAEAAKKAAELASQAKSDFLARMSHEIRTPMNGVIGMTHLLLQTDLDSRQRDFARKVRKSAQALLRVINDILDFSKVEAGRLEIETIPFSLERVLEELSDLTVFSAEEKGLELTLFIEENIPDGLLGDPLRLGQILLNLVSNAIKFTDKGEIVITARLASRTEDGKVEVLISVTDTGIGIPEQIIPHLFDSFTQADGSTTRKYGGTGLGLAICKHLVELMGGELTVQSTPGKGTTFSFNALCGVQGEAMPLPKPSTDLRGTRALVVEDNQTTREVLVHMLKSFGFEVTGASSGQTALLSVELAAQNNAPFELVILDWKMPGLDGIETSLAIRKLLGEHSVPHMLMVSAHTRKELSEKAAQAGIEHALSKPIHRSNLFNAIMETYGRQTLDTTRSMQQVMPDLAHVQGARILIVEDNEINRQVIRELLEQGGLHVEEAFDGEAALNMLSRRDHGIDLVLMDIEMPGMNGYETCTRLRQRDFLQNLPILAMTAHALQDDRDKSIKAGMDDHLVKPIDPDAVYRAIARWVPPRRSPARAVRKKNRVVSDIKEILPESIAGLDYQAGLRRIGGNPETYRKALLRFTQRYRTVSEELRRGQNPEELRQTVHGIKGVAGNLGATELAQCCMDLEQELETNGNTESRIGRLADCIDTLSSSIAGAIPEETLPAGPRKGEDTGQCSRLGDLPSLLDSDIALALDTWEEIRSDVKVHFPGLATGLDAALQQFRIEEARELISQIVCTLPETHTPQEQQS